MAFLGHSPNKFLLFLAPLSSFPAYVLTTHIAIERSWSIHRWWRCHRHLATSAIPFVQNISHVTPHFPKFISILNVGRAHAEQNYVRSAALQSPISFLQLSVQVGDLGTCNCHIEQFNRALDLIG